MTVHGAGSTPYLQMVAVTVPASHEDFFPLVVLDTVLGGAKSMSFFGGGGTTNRSSRLYRALVDTELAAEVSSSVQPTVDPFLFSCSVTPVPERDLQQVEDALCAELERIVAEPISSVELDTAVKQTRAQFAYSSETVTNWGFWLGFSEVVASDEWFYTYLDGLARVTIEDVQRVAQTYLPPHRRTVGWYVPDN